MLRRFHWYVGITLLNIAVMSAAVWYDARYIRAPKGVPRPVLPCDQVDVLFSPRGGCTDRVVREVDAARDAVYVQAYSFTSKPIAEALDRAWRRGVRVELLLDADANRESKSSRGRALHEDGIPVRYDAAHPIAHNKVIILDGRAVVCGSFNFSAQAENNAENLTVFTSRRLAALYLQNYLAHAAHATAEP